MKLITGWLFDFLLILKSEFKRDLIFMKRYPLDPLSFLFFMYLILLSIILGLSQLVPQGQAATASLFNREKMILGYCLMQFVFATQMGWSGQIQYESQTGTLEQLGISGHSLGNVLLARGLAQMPRQILSFWLLLFAYTLSLSGLDINMNHLLATVPVLFVMAFGIFGISYLFAGITLLFKRVGMFFQIVNFAFLGIFWQDRSGLEGGFAFFYDHFPLSVGMAGMQNILVTGSEAPAFSLFYLAAVSLVYFAAGQWLFRMMEKKSRELGLLSQY